MPPKEQQEKQSKLQLIYRQNSVTILTLLIEHNFLERHLSCECWLKTLETIHPYISLGHNNSLPSQVPSHPPFVACSYKEQCVWKKSRQLQNMRPGPLYKQEFQQKLLIHSQLSCQLLVWSRRTPLWVLYLCSMTPPTKPRMAPYFEIYWKHCTNNNLSSKKTYGLMLSLIFNWLVYFVVYIAEAVKRCTRSAILWCLNLLQKRIEWNLPERPRWISFCFPSGSVCLGSWPLTLYVAVWTITVILTNLFQSQLMTALSFS